MASSHSSHHGMFNSDQALPSCTSTRLDGLSLCAPRYVAAGWGGACAEVWLPCTCADWSARGWMPWLQTVTHVFCLPTTLSAREKAKRRCPKRYRYSGTACPQFRRVSDSGRWLGGPGLGCRASSLAPPWGWGLHWPALNPSPGFLPAPPRQEGSCVRGDACPYAHGIFECWLHPTRYRTQVPWGRAWGVDAAANMNPGPALHAPAPAGRAPRCRRTAGILEHARTPSFDTP